VTAATALAAMRAWCAKRLRARLARQKAADRAAASRLLIVANVAQTTLPRRSPR